MPQPNYNEETTFLNINKIEDKHPNTQKTIQTDINQKWKKSKALLAENLREIVVFFG